MIIDINHLANHSDARSRVWLDGVEVTHDCFYADDDAGIVRVYQRDAVGNISKSHPWEEKRGAVSIERPRPTL